MRKIKFRQPINVKGKFARWHYWGFFLEGRFIGPHNVNDSSYEFTGLHDKNGKEIYEGDVVSRFSDTQRSIVEFKDGCFVSMIQLSGGSRARTEILCNDLSVTEVIGNIWETPNLIGG